MRSPPSRRAIGVRRTVTYVLRPGASRLSFLPALTFLLLLQIAKDCTEGREVAEEEEDTAWAEVQDDPWGNVAHPVDEAN